MTFLAMIIALSLHQVIQPGSFLQRDAWLFQWDKAVAARISNETARTLITLGVVVLVVIWVLSVIDDWLFGLAELLATAGLFVWSLGRDDFHTALERYEARVAVDSEGACEILDNIWAPLSPESDSEAQTVALQRLIYSGYARWFAPLFYFVVGGAPLAVLYRVLSLLCASEGSPLYLRVLRWADWMPARILGLTFALSGDFLAVSKRAPLAHLTDTTRAPQLLLELAGVACNNVGGARVLGDILYRSAGLWLLVLSAVLILG
ncbi:regulatory signaling modulator protein AmpE [Congregibacter brevis]|uniref:Regulatory signaling modulator protein AmpE n=1 Tax=Congregibacter brevis TaxID=3081201 RepID=A0ABZ0IFU0_9GAMM|nr:regulatory signaling modulator protein AmpE [Congregibacter sp. IMCC45268]